jgi:hypothetical protein
MATEKSPRKKPAPGAFPRKVRIRSGAGFLLPLFFWRKFQGKIDGRAMRLVPRHRTPIKFGQQFGLTFSVYFVQKYGL